MISLRKMSPKLASALLIVFCLFVIYANARNAITSFAIVVASFSTGFLVAVMYNANVDCCLFLFLLHNYIVKLFFFFSSFLLLFFLIIHLVQTFTTEMSFGIIKSLGMTYFFISYEISKKKKKSFTM